jgi:hypothetical protein
LSAREREYPPIVRLVLRFRLELGFGLLVAALFADYLFTDRLLYGSDSIPSGLFFRALLVDFVKQFHEMPKWNPYILGGLPFLDATHGDTFFPSSLLQFIFPVYRGMGHKLLLHIVLAGAFMAFYLRSLRLHPRAVAIGGLCYMLSPVFVSYLFAGQDGKMYVTSLAPLVLGLAERAMSTGSVKHFVGLGLAIGITILSSQIQMAYHCMWFLGALFVLRLVRGPASGEAAPPRLRTTGFFLGAILIGLLVAAVQLVPAVAYVKNPAGFSVRSERTDYEHASSWSLHPEEVASMVVPEFCNAPRGYWGRNVFKYNSDYVGILTLFLAGLALARKRDATRWFLGGLALFAVLYSLGGHTPLHRLFFAVVPQVKLFRAPPLVMFGAAFGLSALAAHAIHDLETEEGGRSGRGTGRRPFRLDRLTGAGLGIAGLLILVGFAAGGLTGFWNNLFVPPLADGKAQVQAANLGAFRTGALLAGLVLGAGVLLVDARRRRALPAGAVIWLLALLTVLDLWRIDRRFKVVMDPDRWLEPDPLVAAVQEPLDREKFRVMPATRRYAFNELGYFGVESVLGFHDNELAWYRELRTCPQAKDLLAVDDRGYPYLRLLNAKFILHESPGYPNPLGVPDYRPRFWLASEWQLVPDRATAHARIADPGFEPARTVLLETDPGLPADEASGGEEPGVIRTYEYIGNEIRVTVETTRDCLLVQSENWFPYWHVLEGERELPLLRAYGVMRAVPLGPGSHSLRFVYRSVPYEAGKWITLATVGLAVVGFGVAPFVRRARRMS